MRWVAVSLLLFVVGSVSAQNTTGVEVDLDILVAELDDAKEDCTYWEGRCESLVKAFVEKHGAEPILALAREGTNERRRVAAVRAIGYAGDEVDALSENGADLMISLLAADVPSAVRAASVEALGIMGDSEDALKLASALDDPEAVVRQAAATALGRIGADSAVDKLSETLASDRDAEIRAAAAGALGGIGAPEATMALKRASESDAEEKVRKAASRALTQL